VKYYSSGMQVRLGFSIASHLDADILLVDEVLAVGDANFQQKCLTASVRSWPAAPPFLFVSHDLAAVEAMCERAMWLTEAIVRAAGPPAPCWAISSVGRGTSGHDVIVDDVIPTRAQGRGHRTGDGMALSGEEVQIRLVLSAPEGGRARFTSASPKVRPCPSFVAMHHSAFPGGDFELRCQLQNLPLPKGRYYVWLALEGSTDLAAAQTWKPVGAFDVFGPTPSDAPRSHGALTGLCAGHMGAL